jgi:hypothetical protein
MDTYTAGLVQQINPLDKPYVPYRTSEDAYYATYTGFVLPGWLISLIAALHAPRRRPEPRPTPIHATQMA